MVTIDRGKISTIAIRLSSVELGGTKGENKEQKKQLLELISGRGSQYVGMYLINFFLSGTFPHINFFLSRKLKEEKSRSRGPWSINSSRIIKD